MIAFKIATAPTVEALERPYPEAERTPPGNYKSDDAVARWREADRLRWEADRTKTFALSPRTGRVVGFAVAEGDGVVFSSVDREEVQATEETEAIPAIDEAELLYRFWTAIITERQVVGWYSMTFDLPFALVRSAILGLPVPIDPAVYLRRYSYRPHLDLGAALTLWGAPDGDLGAWLDAFGLPRPQGNGAAIAAAYAEGDRAEVARLLASNAQGIYDLAERAGRIFNG